MSDDHRTGRLCADAARLARIHFVRKSMRPRMSSRGLSIPARARRVNLFGSSTYGREESCRMQVSLQLCISALEETGEIAVHASQLVRARLRLNECCCPRERQTCTTFGALENHPNRSAPSERRSQVAMLCCCRATLLVYTLQPQPRGQVRVFPPPSIRRAAWQHERAQSARAARARPRPPATCHLLKTPHTARLPLAGQ